MKTKVKVFSGDTLYEIEIRINSYARDNNYEIISVSIAAKPNGSYYMAAVFEEKDHEQIN